MRTRRDVTRTRKRSRLTADNTHASTNSRHAPTRHKCANLWSSRVINGNCRIGKEVRDAPRFHARCNLGAQSGFGISPIIQLRLLFYG